MPVHVDDRVVLPLSKVVMAANTLCALACSRDRTVHDDDCLIPLLEVRERLLAEDAARRPHGGVSPDCQVGGVKCRACTGCSHDCHRHCTACGVTKAWHDDPRHAWQNGTTERKPLTRQGAFEAPNP